MVGSMWLRSTGRPSWILSGHDFARGCHMLQKKWMVGSMWLRSTERPSWILSGNAFARNCHLLQYLMWIVCGAWLNSKPGIPLKSYPTPLPQKQLLLVGSV
eukprot:11089-Pelagomonas_calceolata.AAC.6